MNATVVGQEEEVVWEMPETSDNHIIKELEWEGAKVMVLIDYDTGFIRIRSSDRQPVWIEYLPFEIFDKIQELKQEK